MSKPAATKGQKGYILGMAKKLGLEMGMDDLRTFNTSEANNMIRTMKKALYGSDDDPCEKMRRKLISMAHTIGWQSKEKADMNRINKWCVQYGQFKKELNEHTYDELTHLISQFQYGPFKTKLENN